MCGLVETAPIAMVRAKVAVVFGMFEKRMYGASFCPHLQPSRTSLAPFAPAFSPLEPPWRHSAHLQLSQTPLAPPRLQPSRTSLAPLRPSSGQSPQLYAPFNSSPLRVACIRARRCSVIASPLDLSRRPLSRSSRAITQDRAPSNSLNPQHLCRGYRLISARAGE